MKIKLTLATATAIGLMMGAAWAGDANTLYIVQGGAGNNTASIHQSTGDGGNDVGTAGDPVNQTGNGNDFRETNATVNTNYYSGNNDITKAEQIGDYNTFTSSYNGRASNNVISNAQQIGDRNYARYFRNSNYNGTITKVLQQGDNNILSLNQEAGSGNVISLVQQIGNGNGGSVQNTAAGQHTGTWIQQYGSNNQIDNSTIIGDNNSGLNDQTHYIRQRGNDNGHIASTAITKGSNGNGIHVESWGDRNNFDVRQGLNTASTGNDATVMQTGDDNWARATQYGSYNQLAVIQNGDHNSSTTLFDGDGNGSGSFTGGPAAGLTNANLVQGQVFQDSGSALTGNSLTYTVYGSNNLFAFAQLGSDNTVSGKVGTGAVDSNGNQVAVLQTGDGNNSTFTQNGGGNNLAVSQ